MRDSVISLDKKPRNYNSNNTIEIVNSNNSYFINGVTYTVDSVFCPTAPEQNTLADIVFRIVDTQSAHLMNEENGAIIHNEYTCLTASKEEICSQ